MIDAARIRVLVVDDHHVVRAALGDIVRYQVDMDLVGLAETAASGMAMFNWGLPDVTLVDLSLPDMNGIDLIHCLKERSPHSRFLVLTANSGGSEIGDALRAGAQQYLFKNAPVAEILATIRELARGPLET